jgi:serine/threonine protein kinase
MAATRVSSEPLAELPQSVPSRRQYGAGDNIDGKYELEALLGKGGMGEVWTARNATLGVRRALKLIRADSGSPDSTDRLLQEARAAAILTDPAIAAVFDFGRTGSGDPYIVMEMLEGEDLMSVINRRERLSPTKAVRVLLPVVRALVVAHGQGIVHRDLKPENIFLSRLPDGGLQPKLLDFGIAKLRNAQQLRLTSAGAVIGSPLYMAPEQGRGEDVDERADIWALCVVLYEAITGSLPFAGDDRAAVLHAVGNLEPKSLGDHGIADGALSAIVRRGLAKSAADRWQSMAELGRALARWLLDSDVSDDITGASLESTWLRGSRRSLLASSLPPERISAADSLESGLVRRGWGIVLSLTPRLRQPYRWLLERVRARPVLWLSGFGGAALMLMTWVALAASRVPALAEPLEAMTTEPAVVFSASPAPGSSARAIPAVGETEGAAKVPEQNPMLARKPHRSNERVAADSEREKRRSKLIDPYR